MWADDGGGVRSRVYYYHFDGTGNVIGLSDSGGDCAEIYRYRPYGKFAIYAPDGSKQDESICGNEYLFTGRRFDGETGLYYLRARMYNPAIGRFLQTDPIGYADGINWYAYCGNNPIMLVDPFGLCGSYSYGGWSQFKTDLGDVGQSIVDGYDLAGAGMAKMFSAVTGGYSDQLLGYDDAANN